MTADFSRHVVWRKSNMQKNNIHQFGSTVETVLYPLLLLLLMWSVFLVEKISSVPLYRWGIFPRDWIGLRGVLFSPLLHAPSDLSHILNNSTPIAILVGALIYFYRAIAFPIFWISWLGSGLLVWIFTKNDGSFHIGMSSVIYALAGFLFVSGTIRKYRPLQGISMFVIFVYGSLIWGIFPSSLPISWEGHLSGLLIGISLAFFFRNKGPQAPKFQYEIEKELGIEPPDLEGQWLENVRLAKERAEEIQQQQANWKIQYHYIPTNSNGTTQSPDETHPPNDPSH